LASESRVRPVEPYTGMEASLLHAVSVTSKKGQERRTGASVPHGRGRRCLHRGPPAQYRRNAWLHLSLKSWWV